MLLWTLGLLLINSRDINMARVSQTSIERAQEWSRQDPNKATAAHVNDLLSKIDTDDIAAEELSTLFPEDGSRIDFGTAGLRSAMEPGPLGMNDLVVIQAAQGIARYCQQQQQGKKSTVVIGYDHRANPDFKLSSLSFALYSILVFETAGMEAILLDGYVHTPLVAFCTRQLGAAVGIMITASHNPKQDAGYKVYWEDGCQIRPPVDSGIAVSIQNNLIPWVDYGALLESLRQGEMDVCCGLSHPQLTKEMTAAYFDAVSKSGLVTGQAHYPQEHAPSFCYTAMHGVGHMVAAKIFEVFGLPPFHSVPSQELPDPTFPTVVFPNPEEKGALDIAKRFAVENQCDIVLANDPDADRLGVAERDRTTTEWTVFTGDQIGIMLGHWLWENVGVQSDKPVAMCASTVSSKMLAEIARVEGFLFEETLTGFKWIGSRAETLSREQGYLSLFCYEEALGFCCGNVVFDKDGITAMGVFAELAYNVYGKGRTLAQHMQSLYDKYGEFVSNNGYYFCNDPSTVTKIMADMQNNGNYMSMVGPYAVESIRDLSEPGYDSTTIDRKPTLFTSKSSPMMSIRFENGCLVQFRASGTEPKFKYYIEMKGQPGVSRDDVTKELEKMCNVILEELLHPEENGLVTPS